MRAHAKISILTLGLTGAIAPASSAPPGAGDRGGFDASGIPASHLRFADRAAVERSFSGATVLGDRPPGAGSTDVSEYMLGRVAIAVILPSSNGAIDPDTENWTRAEVRGVVRAVERGLRFWLERGPGDLEFVVEFDGVIPTSYEPINRPAESDGLWIGEILAQLGHDRGGYMMRAYERVGRLIAENDADWGGLIFAVDSENDPGGDFADGYSAYAYFGGPMVVTPTTPNNEPLSVLDSYMAHEFAHLFYADDEYFWGMSDCRVESGYLSVPNGNSAFGIECAARFDCIMHVGYLPETSACGYSLAQVGRYDHDDDGIPWILDTRPAVEWMQDPPVVVPAGEPFELSAVARVSPRRNRNPFGMGRAITINRIQRIQSRLDGGEWIDRPAQDGIYDQGVEGTLWVEDGLAPGSHVIEVRGYNTIGNFNDPLLRTEIVAER